MSIKCSIHKTEDATHESTCNPGVYYCDKCTDYVMQEYGSNRVQSLNNPQPKKESQNDR